MFSVVCVCHSVIPQRGHHLIIINDAIGHLQITWGPPGVIVCLSRVALGVLSFIKCGTLLARHRSCKITVTLAFWFGGSREA